MNGPASIKQKKYLRIIGIKFNKNISKKEASNIISKYYGKDIYKCRKCNKPVVGINGKLSCCNITESEKSAKATNIAQERQISRAISELLSGSITHELGMIDFVDDGNGSQWYIEDDWEEDN